jgi:hypothetical protein
MHDEIGAAQLMGRDLPDRVTEAELKRITPHRAHHNRRANHNGKQQSC